MLNESENTMNCQNLQNEFDDRLDGRLEALRTQAFDAHLDGCSACRQAWQVYRMVWEVVSRQSSIAPSFGFAQRTLRRLHEQVDRRFWQLPVFRWATALSLLVIISVTGVMTYRQVETAQSVAAYTAAHHDHLEDFDVIVALDSLKGDSEL